ncbi:HAMP domain-containing protein [Candidatus Poribacteria bacterium]|nr:HAMP domain-containing protein [Candidatus Poribacteria bacterium]
MNKKIKINLHYKITITFIVISAIILLGIFISLNKNIQEQAYDIIKKNLLKQTFFTKKYLEEDYDKYQQNYELDKFADKIGKNLNLRVTIIGLDGKVLGDSELDGDNLKNVENHLDRPEVKQALESGIGENKRYSATIKKNMLYIAQTFGNDKPLGIIRLSVPINEIELISNHVKSTLKIYLLIAFILIILITFLALIFISKPIREISSIARDFAKGNFSKKIIHSSNDEIGDLIDAFNFMTEQITMRMDEITKSKSRQEAVLLSMFEGLMLVDLSSNILLINQALRELFLIKDDVTDKKPIEIIRNHEIQKIIDCTLKRKCGVEACEIFALTPDEKVLLVHAAPVIREQTVEGAVLVFHDITELKKLEKIRKEFVANVSHELRTPVSSIIS